jgi:hypothetical protein
MLDAVLVLLPKLTFLSRSAIIYAFCVVGPRSYPLGCDATYIIVMAGVSLATVGSARSVLGNIE